MLVCVDAVPLLITHQVFRAFLKCWHATKFSDHSDVSLRWLKPTTRQPRGKFRVSCDRLCRDCPCCSKILLMMIEKLTYPLGNEHRPCQIGV